MSKVKIKNVNEKTIKEKFWVWCAIISMTVYVVWRIFFTVPDHNIYGWVATICGIFLVAAETISMLEGTEHFTRLRRKSIPEKPVLPLDWFPDVDVFIATHNESADLLYKTVNGCKHMRYPDRKKVHIYLCDDSNRPEVAALARKMGVGYFGMEENKLAKAGNLNHALSLTHSPYVATFDADMIPTREFLMETVPYMFLPRLKQLDDGTWAERSEDEVDEDFKMGFIQTPQSFYNPDLFQFNFYSEKRIPNEQDFFFREINVGRNRANAPIYAGSNTLISREALDEVGGIATGTITEDFETGIKIQAKGYTCYALDKAFGPRLGAYRYRQPDPAAGPLGKRMHILSAPCPSAVSSEPEAEYKIKLYFLLALLVDLFQTVYLHYFPHFICCVRNPGGDLRPLGAAFNLAAVLSFV